MWRLQGHPEPGSIKRHVYPLPKAEELLGNFGRRAVLLKTQFESRLPAASVAGDSKPFGDYQHYQGPFPLELPIIWCLCCSFHLSKDHGELAEGNSPSSCLQ